MQCSLPFNRLRIKSNRRVALGATAAVIFALFCQWWLRQSVGDSAPLAILASSIAFVAVCFGSLPGLLATAAAAVGATVFVLPPVFSFRIASSRDRWQLVFFLIEGVSLSSINAVYQHVKQRRKDGLQQALSREVQSSHSAAAERERERGRRESEESRRLFSALSESLRTVDFDLAQDLAALAAIKSAQIDESCSPCCVIDELATVLRARYPVRPEILRDYSCRVRGSRHDLRTILESVIDLPLSLAGPGCSLEISVNQTRVPDAVVFSIVLPATPKTPRSLARLAISRRLIDGLGGRIWEQGLLTGESGRFSFSLPRA